VSEIIRIPVDALEHLSHKADVLCSLYIYEHYIAAPAYQAHRDVLKRKEARLAVFGLKDSASATATLGLPVKGFETLPGTTISHVIQRVFPNHPDTEPFYLLLTIE